MSDYFRSLHDQWQTASIHANFVGSFRVSWSRSRRLIGSSGSHAANPADWQWDQRYSKGLFSQPQWSSTGEDSSTGRLILLYEVSLGQLHQSSQGDSSTDHGESGAPQTHAKMPWNVIFNIVTSSTILPLYERIASCPVSDKTFLYRCSLAVFILNITCTSSSASLFESLEWMHTLNWAYCDCSGYPKQT